MTSIEQKPKALKAYEVRESGEGCCTIEFATSGVAARRNGAGELCVDFEDIESCCRAPWADEFAPGPVPLRATLEAGWWHECQHCGVQFDEDGRRPYDSDDERDDAFEPVQDAKQNNFCSPACMMEQWATRRLEKAREHAIIEAALIKWPEAISASAGRYRKERPSYDDEWRASFTLPGLKYSVQWVPGSADAYVCHGDLEAFNRLYGVKA